MLPPLCCLLFFCFFLLRKIPTPRRSSKRDHYYQQRRKPTRGVNFLLRRSTLARALLSIGQLKQQSLPVYKISNSDDLTTEPVSALQQQMSLADFVFHRATWKPGQTQVLWDEKEQVGLCGAGASHC